MSWNRTYRPKQVSQLHLHTVRSALQQFLERGKIPQALLFTGPKGTGKTSASRIIGAVLNDPANEAAVEHAYFTQAEHKSQPLLEPQLDAPLAASIFAGTAYVVQELDAASNRGIDDIRQLKERVQLPPQHGKMAVYILDEVHMLTTEAFNALLKLLEEPPAHAVFILATTELHKIPDTIVSRCHVVQFSRATEAEIVSALQQIAAQENITFESDALSLIAVQADGSFRDAVKLFEHCAASGSVTANSVSELLQHSSQELVHTLLSATLFKDAMQISEIFLQVREHGIQPKFFHTALLQQLHQALMQNLGVQTGEPIAPQPAVQFLLQELAPAELSAPSPIPLLQLELKLLELVLRAKKNGGSSQGDRGAGTRTTSAPPTAPATRNTSEKKAAQETIPSVPGDGQLLCERWSEFVDKVQQKNSTVAALLRSAQPVSGNTGSALVRVYYKFHQEQLSQPKFMQLTRDCVLDVSGGDVQLEFEVDSPPPSAELSDSPRQAGLEKLAVEALM